MKHTLTVKKHFDSVSTEYDIGKEKYSYYYDHLKKLLEELIGNRKRILEIGCGTGNLIASLKPHYGVGIDISPAMIRLAKIKYKSRKNLIFSTKMPREKFDSVFMSDVVEHLEDSKDVFRKIYGLLDRRSIFVNTMANPIWEPLLMLWERLGLKMKEGPHYRKSFKTLERELIEVGFKIDRHGYRLLIPVDIPLVTPFFNKHLEKYLKPLCFIEYFVASIA